MTNSPSIFSPLFSQFNLINMLSSVAVNSLGEMVPLSYSSLDPDFVHSLCADVLSLSCPYICLSGFSMYTSGNDVNIAWVCT